MNINETGKYKAIIQINNSGISIRSNLGRNSSNPTMVNENISGPNAVDRTNLQARK
jgi:hypothetical protein